MALIAISVTTTNISAVTDIAYTLIPDSILYILNIICKAQKFMVIAIGKGRQHMNKVAYRSI
ncbi:hypothetical protein CONCODRAFT_13106 [Conidiobolus coronatus NRRL 28638]|uniref:Uncharacterized protein n=1 Tax=Conidiobolus coronatus (strain ATCC 28846 / CBS 209.66 / NRRL 28638) TaxID=796925 RepID=A0A137NRN1_CONC2|nr:hypothetical protein CONCODRAFT_13106 [Conidiobolus coronatus NRRL 28638]|eukprot:KXN65340.1 hypothetical protein CONCODRAFT_13106 [Conidiobolus coronatus NRRL 28638]